MVGGDSGEDTAPAGEPGATETSDSFEDTFATSVAEVAATVVFDAQERAKLAARANFEPVSTGYSYTCGIDRNDTVQCWGPE